MLNVQGTGVVQEVRDLKDKGGSVWKRLLKLAYMGGVAEFAVDKDVDQSTLPKSGQRVEVKGHVVQDYKGNTGIQFDSAKSVPG